MADAPIQPASTPAQLAQPDADGVSHPPVQQPQTLPDGSPNPYAINPFTPGGPGGAGQSSAPGTVTSLGNWRPGDTYAGTSPPGGTTDKSFIPQVPANEPTATNWNVTPEQTVQGQMDQLTKNIGTNPVYQSLAAQLTRASAAQGNQNSLMAETAAYNQVVGLAYNVASQDAATYAKSAEFNATMANQFGLAQQQFMHTALLSDQNYKQSQVLQSEQINGNLQSVSMQIAGQIKSTSIAASAQRAAAGISANASIQNAKLASETSLKEAAMQQQTTLDGLQIGFQNQWMLSEQAQGHQLQQMGQQFVYQGQLQSNISSQNFMQGMVGTQYQDEFNNAMNTKQFGQQMTLNAQADFNANLRQLSQNIAMIGATPGLTAEQQANAISTITNIFKQNQSMSSSFYGSSTNGIANGTVGNSITGNNVIVPPLPTWTPPAPSPDQNPYTQYGNYLAYPGYELTAPPTAPFFGGTGGGEIGKQPPSAGNMEAFLPMTPTS